MVSQFMTAVGDGLRLALMRGEPLAGDKEGGFDMMFFQNGQKCWYIVRTRIQIEGQSKAGNIGGSAVYRRAARWQTACQGQFFPGIGSLQNGEDAHQ